LDKIKSPKAKAHRSRSVTTNTESLHYIYFMHTALCVAQKPALLRKTDFVSADGSMCEAQKRFNHSTKISPLLFIISKLSCQSM
jgi:hypothetical protein